LVIRSGHDPALLLHGCGNGTHGCPTDA
jgi:hypothetical protein